MRPSFSPVVTLPSAQPSFARIAGWVSQYPSVPVCGRKSAKMANDAKLIERERSCLVVIDVQQELPRQAAARLACSAGRTHRLADARGVRSRHTGHRHRRGRGARRAACAGARALPAARRTAGLRQDGVRAVGARRTSAPRWKHPAGTPSCWSGWKPTCGVAQSALGLRAAGYRVAVVGDACASPPPNHEHGLDRLRDTGVILTSVKTTFYEWTRDLETTHRVRAELQVPYPTGITF